MKTKIIFLAAFVVIVAVILAFAIFPLINRSQEQSSDKINIGFTTQNVSYAPGLLSFESVTKRIESVSFDNNETNVSTPADLHILYISGTGVDESGNAVRWMFAVKHRNTSSVVTYDKNGESVVSWPSQLTGQEINLHDILSPGELFKKNEALLSGMQQNSGAILRELSLSGNNYTISLSIPGKTQVLQFDAKSGALTSTQ